jgi:hypothetical protein
MACHLLRLAVAGLLLLRLGAQMGQLPALAAPVVEPRHLPNPSRRPLTPPQHKLLCEELKHLYTGGCALPGRFSPGQFNGAAGQRP